MQRESVCVIATMITNSLGILGERANGGVLGGQARHHGWSVNITKIRMLVDVTIQDTIQLYKCTTMVRYSTATIIAEHCQGEQASICSRVGGLGARFLETVCLTEHCFALALYSTCTAMLTGVAGTYGHAQNNADHRRILGEEGGRRLA